MYQSIPETTAWKTYILYELKEKENHKTETQSDKSSWWSLIILCWSLHSCRMAAADQSLQELSECGIQIHFRSLYFSLQTPCWKLHHSAVWTVRTTYQLFSAATAAQGAGLLSADRHAWASPISHCETLAGLIVFGFQTHADGRLLSIRMTNWLGSPSAKNLRRRVLNSDQESLDIYLKFLRSFFRSWLL